MPIGILCINGTFSNIVVSTELSSNEANSSILETAIIRNSCFARSIVLSAKSLLPLNKLSGFTHAICSFQLSTNETIYAKEVPPAASPRSARPIICVISIVETVGLAKNTVLVCGKSIPSVSIFTFTSICTLPDLYSSIFLSLSSLLIRTPVIVSLTSDTINSDLIPALLNKALNWTACTTLIANTIVCPYSFCFALYVFTISLFLAALSAICPATSSGSTSRRCILSQPLSPKFSPYISSV